MRRVGVLSNPRSGTSLMVYLLVSGFNLCGWGSLFPYLGKNDIYEFRCEVGDLLSWGTRKYHVVFVIRDPRNVIVSKHPATNEYLVDFGAWYVNYKKCLHLSSVVNINVVRFEDILSNPSKVQESISSFLGLPVLNDFNCCYKCKPSVELSRVGDLVFEMGGLRSLGPQKQNWKLEVNKDRIVQQLIQFPEIIQMVVELGYEEDYCWVDDLTR